MARSVNGLGFQMVLEESPVQMGSIHVATLELRIRTFLEPYAPPADDHTVEDSVGERRVVSWSSTPGPSFTDFRRSFRSAVEDSWNGKLFLVADDPWGGYYRAHGHLFVMPVACRLAIRWVSRREHAHLHARCYKLHPDEPFHRSSMQANACIRWVRGLVGMAHGHLDHHDVVTHGGQIPVAHEIGHYIGLPHVACDSNDDECYGAPGSYQAGDIMGRGMRVDLWHVRPWRDAMRNFSRTRFRPAFTAHMADIGPEYSAPRGPLSPGGMPDGGV